MATDFGVTLSQALNSLKHTPESFAIQNNLNAHLILQTIKGDLQPSEELIEVLKNHPLIDYSAFDSSHTAHTLTENSLNHYLYWSASQKDDTSRQFSRHNTPYYIYKDLAATYLSPFLPEHITPLVIKSDPTETILPAPYFNKGHLEHQITFFIGDINFHWKENNTEHVKCMKNLSSNYIVPYVPHTFTSRSPGSYIVAVTYKSMSSEIGVNSYLNTVINTSTTSAKTPYTHEVANKYIHFFEPSFNKLNALLSSRTRAPLACIHSLNFITSCTPNKRHSWLYVIHGTAECFLLHNSNYKRELFEGDSILCPMTPIQVLMKGADSIILEISLDINPSSVSLHVEKEISDLYTAHGHAIFDRIKTDKEKWF